MSGLSRSCANTSEPAGSSTRVAQPTSRPASPERNKRTAGVFGPNERQDICQLYRVSVEPDAEQFFTEVLIESGARSPAVRAAFANAPDMVAKFPSTVRHFFDGGMRYLRTNDTAAVGRLCDQVAKHHARKTTAIATIGWDVMALVMCDLAARRFASKQPVGEQLQAAARRRRHGACESARAQRAWRKFVNYMFARIKASYCQLVVQYSLEAAANAAQ